MQQNQKLFKLLFLCFLSCSIYGQGFNKTFDLSVGAEVSRLQFNFKSEYLIKSKKSVYARIDFQQRDVVDAIIGIDTINNPIDTTLVITRSRFSSQGRYNMNLSIGYRLYSGNYYNHSKFFVDIGVVYTIMLYEDSIIVPESLRPWGLRLGIGYKFYLNDNLNLNFNFLTDSRIAKGNSGFIDVNGNIGFGIGYIFGGRQLLNKDKRS